MSFSLFLASLVALPTSAQEQQMADLGNCALESGEVLEDCRVGFHTVGQLNEDRDNTIVIPSWYGGSSGDWVELQAGLLGEDHDYFVVAVDALGNGVSVSPSNSSAQAPLRGRPEFERIIERARREQERVATRWASAE